MDATYEKIFGQVKSVLAGAEQVVKKVKGIFDDTGGVPQTPSAIPHVPAQAVPSTKITETTPSIEPVLILLGLLVIYVALRR